MSRHQWNNSTVVQAFEHRVARVYRRQRPGHLIERIFRTDLYMSNEWVSAHLEKQVLRLDQSRLPNSLSRYTRWSYLHEPIQTSKPMQGRDHRGFG